MCMCVISPVCMYVCMCVCELTPVNTEKCEAPVPSRRAWGRQQAQELQDSVSTLGECLHSLPSPSAAPGLLLQHPVGPKETCCVCSAGGNAAPALMELTVHEGHASHLVKHLERRS